MTRCDQYPGVHGLTRAYSGVLARAYSGVLGRTRAAVVERGRNVLSPKERAKSAKYSRILFQSKMSL